MSKYSIGMDFAQGDDYSAYVVCRKPNWFEKLLRKLKLSRAKWEWKVVDSWTDPLKETKNGEDL